MMRESWLFLWLLARFPCHGSYLDHVNSPEMSEIRQILEEENQMGMDYYHSGIHNHIVDYENHPYDDGERRLQSNTTTTTRFEPMRIRFETAALDAVRTTENARKIEWIESEILPRVAEFWSETLSVVPVRGNLRISGNLLIERRYCGDSVFTEVPSEHFSQGLPNTDLVLYLSGSNDRRFCPTNTLAVAVRCNTDQWDRPTAGAINVCLDNIQLNADGTASEQVTRDYMDVTLHEVGHVLGHASTSYRYFYDPDTGEPRTTRPFSTSTQECVNGVSKTTYFPATNTLEFFTSNSGQRYAAIVTPKVKTVARNQFNCQTLPGGQLENQPTGANSCTGDHWDERLFFPEAMSGIISTTTNILSSITLALLEDSGWYQANYTNSRMSPWGLGAGCEFVEEPCLSTQNGQAVVPEWGRGEFCSTQGERACSAELSHKMSCWVRDYADFIPQTLPPTSMQYFPGQPTLGGPQRADFCPVYAATYQNQQVSELDCRNTANGGTAFNVHNEVYGPESRCIPSTAGEGRCYRTACVKDARKLRINVGGQWLTCDEDFQRIDLGLTQANFPQTLVCPKLSQACPELFCPFNCAGRGICNYDAVDENGVVRPQCECFDTNDTSEGCSESALPDGGFLEDSTGLFDNIEENFFDPLVAVFVDHPDKWATASWAWAGGLLAILLVLLVCICSSFWPQRNNKVYGHV